MTVSSVQTVMTALVASGYLDGTTKDQLLRSGIKDVLRKPFRMREILAAIRSVMADDRA
jgi:DNA-binding response OmpR family regulator